MAEKQMIIDENCFVIPPLHGPIEETALSGKPFISGITPVPSLGKVFDVDDLLDDEDDEDEVGD